MPVVLCTVAIPHTISRATCCLVCGARYFRRPYVVPLQRKQLETRSVHLCNAMLPWDSAFDVCLHNKPQNWLLHEFVQKCLQHYTAVELGKYLKLLSSTVAKLGGKNLEQVCEKYQIMQYGNGYAPCHEIT